MECIPPANPTTSAGSSSKAKKSKEKKGGKQSKGVKLSTDPQSVAARERRHRISDRFKILQSMVPGGSKMDTVSMLEEAIHYVKFLQTQIWLHQNMINSVDDHDQQSPVPMFLPHYFPSEQFNSLQPNTSIDDSPQSLTQLPEAQYCCSQGEVANFDATMKYWPA